MEKVNFLFGMLQKHNLFKNIGKLTEIVSVIVYLNNYE